MAVELYTPKEKEELLRKAGKKVCYPLCKVCGQEDKEQIPSSFVVVKRVCQECRELKRGGKEYVANTSGDLIPTPLAHESLLQGQVANVRVVDDAIQPPPWWEFGSGIGVSIDARARRTGVGAVEAGRTLTNAFRPVAESMRQLNEQTRRGEQARRK